MHEHTCMNVNDNKKEAMDLKEPGGCWGHVWVSSPAIPGVHVDVHGLCYHTGHREPCMLKSQSCFETALTFTCPGRCDMQ